MTPKPMLRARPDSATPATSTRPLRAASPPPSTATSPPTPPEPTMVKDVTAALQHSHHCLVLTQRTDRLNTLAQALTERGHDPVVLRGGMGPRPAPPPTPGYSPRPTGRRTWSSPPAAHPRRLRLPHPRHVSPHPSPSKAGYSNMPAPYIATPPGKTTAEVHDYHDILTGVLGLVAGQTRRRLHQPRLPTHRVPIR